MQHGVVQCTDQALNLWLRQARKSRGLCLNKIRYTGVLDVDPCTYSLSTAITLLCHGTRTILLP